MIKTMEELYAFLDSLDWTAPETEALCSCDECTTERGAEPRPSEPPL